MADYKVPPKPSADKNAGRSATPVSERMGGGGPMSSDGSMGKHQKTGSGMENEGGGNPKSKKRKSMHY